MFRIGVNNNFIKIFNKKISKVKLTISLIIVVALVLITYNVLIFTSECINAKAEIRNKVQVMVNLGGLAVNQPLWDIDDNALKYASEALFYDKEVGFVEVKSPNNEVLFKKSLIGQKQYNADDMIYLSEDVKREVMTIGRISIGVTKYYKQKVLMQKAINSMIIIIIIILLTYLSIKAILTQDKFNSRILALKEFYETILNSLPVPVFVKDINHRWIFVNDEYAKFYGLSKSSILKKLEKSDEIKEKDKQLFESKAESINEEKVTDSNGIEHTIVSRKSVFDIADTGRILVGVDYDISELKHVESLLKSSLAKLEDSNRELEQFAYVASHDLHEPLRVISSFVQLLDRKYSDKFDDTAKQYMDFVIDGARRMADMINDLLSYSRVNSDNNPFVRVSADLIIKDSVMNIQQLIEETKTKIDITDAKMPDVLVNTSQITRVFQNIISNAIKYRKPDVNPEISIRIKDDEDKYIFIIQDNGIGMEEKFIPHAFEMFKRYHSREEYSGTGMGLAISKRIVHKHGGEIRIESEVGKGSTFYISMPKE